MTALHYTTLDPESRLQDRRAILSELSDWSASTARLTELTGLRRGDVASELRRMESLGYVTRERRPTCVVWRIQLLGVAALHQLLRAGV